MQRDPCNRKVVSLPLWLGIDGTMINQEIFQRTNTDMQ